VPDFRHGSLTGARLAHLISGFSRNPTHDRRWQ